MSDNSSGGAGDERRRRADQETAQQPVVGNDRQPRRLPQPPQGQSPQPSGAPQSSQRPYGAPPAPPQSLGQGYGQGFGQQPGGYQPQQQQPPGQQPPPYQPHDQPGPQQPYFPESAQPCFPLLPTKLSTPARLVGWIPVALAVIAFLGCFGPWAAVKIDGGFLGTTISATNSVNAFNHQSCSSSGGNDACNSSDQNSSNSGSSMSTSDDGSLWEGWVVALVALLVAGLGVVRGLGIRAAALPAAVVAGVGGLALIGLPVYRLLWISDKRGELKDAMQAQGVPAGFDISLGAGWGLWLVLAMGVAMLGAAAAGVVKRR